MIILRLCRSCKADELKTEKDCLRFALSVCTIGELDRVECTGYEDMDTHENFCQFNSQKEFADGLDEVKKIDADRIKIYLNVNGKPVKVTVGPCWDKEEGNYFTAYGDEDVVKVVWGCLNMSSNNALCKPGHVLSKWWCFSKKTARFQKKRAVFLVVYG